VKILLDNRVHYRAKTLFPGHEVSHARDEGWRALANGELLAQAAKRFDVLVTTDKNIRYEHRLDALPVPVIELNSRFKRWLDLQSLSPFFAEALQNTGKYRFVSISEGGAMELLGERKEG
jgi:hypothetical protein